MTDKKKSIIFIICSYLFFWIAFSLIGVVMVSMGEDALWFQEGAIFQLMVSLSAWTPTLALFVLFKKLYPNSSIKEFYQNAFRERLNIKLLLFMTSLQLLVFFSGVGVTALVGDVSVTELLNISFSTLITGFFWTSLQGATGEQSGWRGFLQPHMEKKFSVIKSSVIVGIVAGFWHTPLWFTSGYFGLELIQFIVFYMIGITCIAVIIGICYNHCKNLFIPIWIHFMFNFTLTMFIGDILSLLTWLTVIYIFITIGFIIWHKRYSLNAISH